VSGLSPEEAPNLRGYGTRRCSRCSFEVIDPVPSDEELADIYRSDYRLHNVNDVNPWRRLGPLGEVIGRISKGLLLIPHRIRFGASIADRRPSGGGRVLEVGFGAGVILERMSQRGWHVHGIEVADAAVASARARIPTGSFAVATVEAAHFPSQTFELILMYHVLEHLADPIGSLRNLGQWLEPAGRLVLAVPNRSSITRRLFGPSWYGYQLPEHLAQYDLTTLTRILELAGLRIVSHRPQAYFHALADSTINRVDQARRHRARALLTKTMLLPAGLLAVVVGDAAALEVEAVRIENS
jgi:SAM-dependent methyltransferase